MSSSRELASGKLVLDEPAEGVSRLRINNPDRRGALDHEILDTLAGTVWKVECEVGQEVEEGDTVVTLESMKMEMPVDAEEGGKVNEIKCSEGQAVKEGDVLVVLE